METAHRIMIFGIPVQNGKGASMKARSIIAGLCFLIVAVALQAQERPVVSPEALITALDEAKNITDSAIELRNRFPDDLATSDFVQAVAELQRRCEPIVVLIAETTPPRELQQFAMNIAMGLKGVELGLWYYLHGVISGQSGQISYGDQLLGQGRAELQVAQALSIDLR